MSVKFQDYYATLGVSRDATQEAIQKAYRALARKKHPDVDKTAGANDRFKKIVEAYEVLKDPEKRKLYDQLGANWKNGQEFTPPPDFDKFTYGSGRARRAPSDFDDMGGFSSFFESLFGAQGGEGGWHTVDADDGEFGAPRSRPRAGRSVDAEITLSLEDAYRGATLSFSIDTGAGPKSYDVKIPAGTTEGRTIRLKGQGGSGRAGASAGDLLLHVRLAPHARFTVQEFDLSTTLAIAPWEAALGAKVSLITLDGSEAVVQVPAGSSSGKKLRLRGLGFPRQQGARGDLLIELRIAVPDSLTDDERKLYEELAQKSPFRPR